jgi:hypothetical protein
VEILHVLLSFSGLSLSFTSFHELLDQFNVVLEAAVLSDKRIEKVELVSITVEGVLGFL